MVLRCSCLFLVTVLIIGTSVKKNVLYAGVLACFLVSFTVQMGFRRGWTWRLMRIRDEILFTTATATRGSSRATSAASSTFLDATVDERDVADLKTMRSLFETVWWLVEPLVFAYMGADYPLSYAWASFIKYSRNWFGLNFASFSFYALLRMFVTYISTCDSQLTNRQRVFIAMAWMPKHSVQVVLLGMVKDRYRIIQKQIFYVGPEFSALFTHVILGFSVLWSSIIMCIGPRLLKPARDVQEGTNDPRPERV